jgi:hypothetical protein
MNVQGRIQNTEFRSQNGRRMLSWDVNSSTTPKSVVNRGFAESLADFAAGRSFGPFKTAQELIDSLHKESAKVRSQPKANRKPRNK